MQVSENGAISFESAVADPPQSPGPSLLQDAMEAFLVAPYWTDFNLGLLPTGGSDVRYETYTPDNQQRRERIETVSSFVADETSGLEAFNATWMLLVEWRQQERTGSDPHLVSIIIIR